MKTATMARKISLVLLMFLLLAAGCGGSGFTPQPGPYEGAFTVNGVQDGSLSFTVINGQLGGTARFTHNDQMVTAAVSGLVSGSQIQANVTATNLGTGTLTGNFVSGDAQGTFTYSDQGQISTTSGTWLAILPEE